MLEPLVIIPGGENAILNIGAMNISPYPVFENLIPTGGSADFRLQLISLTGPGGTPLMVKFLHGDHTHSMSAGSMEKLSITSAETIYFSLPGAAAPGTYEAKFRISTSAYYT